MSKATAKHHKKAERHEHEPRQPKRARRGSGTVGKKQATRAPEAHSQPIPNTIEVMEIAVVAEPEDFLEADETDLLLVPMEGSLDDEQ